jgi:hypothetical protein
VPQQEASDQGGAPRAQKECIMDVKRYHLRNEAMNSDEKDE